jgi:hypothetical protein
MEEEEETVGGEEEAAFEGIVFSKQIHQKKPMTMTNLPQPKRPKTERRVK